MTYASDVLADSPLDFYQMETLTGTDSGSGARTATLANITQGAGNVGNGWVFNGTNAQATMGTFPSLTTNFTLEVWFKSNGANGWTNDYPTFIRRDGTDVILIRGRNSSFASGASPGRAELYISSGVSITTTGRFDDGLWHHAVATVAGNAVKFYVDNVLIGSATASKSTHNFGTGPGYIGGNAGLGAEFYQGTLDNAAFYGTALSATRIGVHYASGQPVNVTYVAAPMTSTANTPTAVVSAQRNVTYAAAPMVASTATMPTATVKQVFPTASTGDFGFDQNGNLSNGDTLFVMGGNQGGGSARITSVLKYTAPPPGSVIDTATLALRQRQGGAGMTIKVYPITAPFTGQPATKAGYTLGAPITFAATGINTTKTLDISSLITQGQQVYGFILEGDDTSSDYVYFWSNEGTTPPVFNIQYHNQIVDKTVTAGPMTATATSPDATISLDTNVTVVATPMTATVSMPTAQVVVDKDMTFVAEPMTASAEFPGGLFSKSIVVAAEPFLASSTMPSSTTATTLGVLYKADAMTASARFVTVAAVNDNPIESDGVNDRYFQRVNALKPTKWARMTDVGRILNDKVSGQPLADINGLVQTGRHDGPESRASLVFNGSGYIQQREPSGTNQDEYITYPHSLSDGNLPHSFEFSFRTDRANEFILGGSDGSMDINTGVASPGNSFTELVLVDGKLGVNQYSVNSQGGVSTVNTSNVARGFRNVADNEWHHVVARNYRSAITGENGFEIWIDGTLEYRRLVRGIITFAWPDYVGYRPTNPNGLYTVTGTLPALPDTQIFHGDLSEMVYYNFQLGKDDIERNRYAFMGWIPFEAGVMEATATMPTAKSKGNQKKALYLYWSGQDEVFGGMPGKAGQKLEDSVSFDPMPNLAADSYAASLAPRLSEETGEFFGFKVFTKSITRNYSPEGVVAYRDPVTDEQSLIDLTRDVDLSEYDVIMFKDWPDEGYERDWYEATYPGQMERVLNQLRDANDKGTGLYVTNPRLAIDLGIVNNIEFVPPLTEMKFIAGQGRAEGMYDYGSAVKFPWNITSSDGLTGNAFATGIGVEADTSASYLAQKAYFYFDNNRNNKFRVVAKVKGLTDLPSYMLEDAVFHVDADNFGWEGAAYKYLHRENGLEIGDEYIFNGSPTIDGRYLDVIEKRYNRGNGVWATPLNAVKAGTVVTTFGANQYVGSAFTTNPYQNYATTIVLETGTPLKGRPTGGRIFVNFTETPSQGLDLPVQVLPGSQDDIDNPLGVDDALDVDAPVFVITGTPEQKAITEQALARCTFPFKKLQGRVKARWGNATFPIVWEDIDPGDVSGVLGAFYPTQGRVAIDQGLIDEWANTHGQDPTDLAMMTIIHELGHFIDYIYLAPYQRVNIWNVFHGDWNVWHEDQNLEDYILPAGYPMDNSTQDVQNGEGWTAPPKEYRNKNLKEAFAQAFVQAYSDLPLDVFAFTTKGSGGSIKDGHPAPESIGPLIRAAIEVGQGAYLFNQNQVDTGWPAGYNEETPAQREWEYSWTRTSLTFSAAALKTRTVNVTMPDGSIQSIVQGSTIGTRGDLPLSMVRSGQLFPVISKPRLEMTARGIYWLADDSAPAAGDVVVRAEPMTANATAPSATTIAQRSTTYIAQSMTATAMSPESAQAKSGNALYLANAMTADAKMSQGSEVTFKAEPMTATATMPDSVYKFTGERITLRVSRPAKITLRIKEAV